MAGNQFNLDMTVADAMKAHPRVAEVFASYHLGGCAHCMVSRTETLEQVCEAYGIDPDAMISSLNSLLEPAAQ